MVESRIADTANHDEGEYLARDSATGMVVYVDRNGACTGLVAGLSDRKIGDVGHERRFPGLVRLESGPVVELIQR